MLKSREHHRYFSEILPGAMFDREGRERKAKTIVAVLSDYLRSDFQTLSLLDIGTSTGIIANYLSTYFGKVIGIDIDKPAIEYARNNFIKENLVFQMGDSMHLNFPKNMFDVVICAQVYEHVANANRLMQEIHRVLKQGGICYFAAGNRLNVKEHHYNLPFLSVIPKQLAHIYLKIAGKGDFYQEKHLSYWGLIKLVRNFELIDYTEKIFTNPQSFHADYMIQEGTVKARLARFIVQYFYLLCPGYIWLLRKPKESKKTHGSKTRMSSG
jgi:2-polyprenyl-3-methyl-5-hydroxy-6-metoxy-1,4-benzoquinol methylase